MYKNLALGTVTSLMLIFAPVTHAQSTADLRTMQTFLDIMNSYFGLIESAYDINSDFEKAATYQLQKIQEVYEDRGEKERSIEVFEDLLKKTDNPVIRNALYMIMSDTLKEAGRSDEAIELLLQGFRENIAAAGGG